MCLITEKIKKIILLFSFGIFMPFLLSCSKAHHDPTENAEGYDPEALKLVMQTPSDIDYFVVSRFVLNRHCISCHNQNEKKDGVNLSSYEVLLNGHGNRILIEPFSPTTSSVYNTLISRGNRHMPPVERAQLTADQIRLVYLWIKNGAKKNSSDKIENPQPLKAKLQPYFDHPENIDYQIVNTYVFSVHCTKCHSLSGEKPDLDAISYSANITDYASLFNQLTPIIKGKPSESKIFAAVAISQSMPPEKNGYDPIDSLRTKLLRLWILNCAIEIKQPDEVLNPDPKNTEKVRQCE